MDWVRKVEQRLNELDQRMKVRHDHLLAALGAQRERMDKGFEEVQRALMEVRMAMLEQELSVRSHLQGLESDVADLRAELKDAVTETGATLADHEARLRKLEGPPPAA